jgi:hypothetical protein
MEPQLTDKYLKELINLNALTVDSPSSRRPCGDIGSNCRRMP